jgi:SpoIIAA-like
MLKHSLDEASGILTIEPQGKLTAADFASLAKEADAFLERHGELNGLLVEAKGFPGWEDFAALSSHLKFVRDHHRRIRRIAVVSDSKVLSIGPRLASHFVSAEVRHFPSSDRAAAVAWLGEAGSASESR